MAVTPAFPQIRQHINESSAPLNSYALSLQWKSGGTALTHCRLTAKRVLPVTGI